jgi:hypothetical protein
MYRVDREWSALMEAECARGNLGAKLGFTRISFSYVASEEVVRYVIEAVHLLADHAWKLLPLYRFDPVSGLWRQRDWASPGRVRLRASLEHPAAHLPVAGEEVLAQRLDAARAIVGAMEADPPAGCMEDPCVSEAFERIRWFPLPGEAVTQLQADRGIHVHAHH